MTTNAAKIANVDRRVPLPTWRSDCGTVALYHGDCNDVLTCLRPGIADVVMTDPPYGISYKTNHRVVSETPEMLSGDGFVDVSCLPRIAATIKDGGALYLCTTFSVYQKWVDACVACGLTVKTPVVWNKNNWTAGDLDGDYGNQCELVIFAHKGRHILKKRKGNLFTIQRPNAGDHPTPKPVMLMDALISNSVEFGGTVIDPFMGGGATGVACVNLGFSFIGIEIDERYFEMSKTRIEAALRQQLLFSPKSKEIKDQEEMFGGKQ